MVAEIWTHENYNNDKKLPWFYAHALQIDNKNI